MKTLFTNCKILLRTGETEITRYAKTGNYSVIDGCLGVDGEYISYIGEALPENAAEYTVKDMAGKLLMPGLVNAHGHAPMTLLRGVGSGLDLQHWLNDAIFPIEAKMTPADIVAGAKLAVLEMLASGTTCFSEMYDFPYEEAEFLEESGIKANISRVGLCFDPSLEPDQIDRLKECRDFVLYGMDNEKCSGRIKYEFCMHSEYLTTENFVKGLADIQKEFPGLPVNIHVSETALEHHECMGRREGRTPVEYFDSMGTFESPCYLAHCVWVEDEDLITMRNKGISLVHNPSSNMKLGSGFAPVVQAMEMGVNVALGTDGTASNNNLNMFEELHLAALIHKGYSNDPTLLTADQIIDMATINGAKALCRMDTGVLEVGKKADIIALDLNKPHLKPQTDIPALIVYSAQGSDVCMTMVDGTVLYENGSYTKMDPDAVYEEFSAAVDRLL